MLLSMTVALFLAVLVSPTLGFSVHKVLKTTTSTPFSLLRQEKITWSDYKRDFIDPIAPHATDKTMLEHWLDDPMDPRKRDSADGYWLEQFEADKERLQNMNQAASSTPETSIPPPTSTWDQYSHKYIDPILRKKTNANLHFQMEHETKQKQLQNMNQGASSTPETSIPHGFPIWDQYNHQYIDPILSSKTYTKVSADKFSLKTVLEEKEKLQNMNQAASTTPETSVSPGFPIWDQYNHKYIDSILPSKTYTKVNADKFSLMTVLEEKEKLQNMNQGASTTPETSVSPRFPIWDQYNHKYIDSI
jgi:hypothetical protein